MMLDAAFVSAILGLAAMGLAPRRNIKAGQFTYWAGTLVTAVSAYFVAQPQGWKSALGASAFTCAAAVFIAYAYTPFLRISFYSRTPQPYGAAVTAKKSWWRLLTAIVVLMFGIVSYGLGKGSPLLAVVAAAAVILSGAIFGYRDAVLGAGIASGQRLQLILTSIVTLGIFVIAYVGAYFVSRRWLLDRGRYGRHAGPGS